MTMRLAADLFTAVRGLIRRCCATTLRVPFRSIRVPNTPLPRAPPSPSCAARDNFPRVAFCVCIPLNICIYDKLPTELTRKAYHIRLRPLSADSEPWVTLG